MKEGRSSFVIKENGTEETYTTPSFSYNLVDFFEDESKSARATYVDVPAVIYGLPVTGIYTNEIEENDSFVLKDNTKYTSVKKINVPNTVVSIGDGAFSCFPSAVEINLSDNLKELGKGAFANMTSLNQITLPENITEIPEYCFYGCTSISKIDFLGKLNKIDYYAFSNCSSLKYIDLPEKMETLNGGAFKATRLVSVTYPVVSKSHNNGVFRDCKKLETVTFLGEEDYNCSIGQLFFDGCESLKNVYFPKECKKVYVGRSAFSNCYSLTDIYFESLKGKIDLSSKNVFENSFRLKTIHYAASEKRWKTFVKEDSVEEKVFKEYDIEFLYNHTHSFERTGKDATCVKGSTHTYSCSCGLKYKYKVDKDPNNHSYGEWKTVKEPTVKSKGKKEKVCSLCQKKVTKSMKKLVKISNCDIKAYTVTYTGKAVKPFVSVETKKSRKTLKKGVHYKASYKNNINIGNEAYVIIKGIKKNGYTGTKKVKFTIAPSIPENVKAPEEKIANTSLYITWKKVRKAPAALYI